MLGKGRRYSLLRIDAPEVKQAFEDFGIKLIKALHYKHTGCIVPVDGGVDVLWRTGMQVKAGEIPKSVVREMIQQPTIKRGKYSYDGQFVYRYNVAVDGGIGMYLVQLGILFFIGFVAFDKSILDKAKETETP